MPKIKAVGQTVQLFMGVGLLVLVVCWSLSCSPVQENSTLASCPWGPVTANGVDLLTEIYVIYMEMHTSHRAIARCFGSGTFTNFGTLPATLATCQYWETHLEEASCRSLTFGKLPKLVGMLPIVPHLTLPGPE